MASAVLSASRSSIYEVVTAQIVAAIEKGAGSFVMPWHGGIVPMSMPLNALTENPYRGINVVSLWAQAAVRLYPTGYWATYDQWRKLGGQVRKGERGSAIVFYKRQDEDDGDDPQDEAVASRTVLRHSHVFNFAQVDGWELPDEAKRPSEVVPNEQIAAFIHATKADIRHGGYRAYYHVQEDYIAMPDRESFRDTPTRSATEGYYAVLLHELTHWTGAQHRLDRARGKRFGDRGYAFEELVAELGAAFLCSAFRLVNLPRPDHAAYIANWLDTLNRDKRAIFVAASLAQQAVEYLRSLAGSDQP